MAEKYLIHRILNRSPYTALFGSEPKMGLGSTNIPSSILAKLKTEEDLENLQNKGNEERKRSRDSNEPEPSDAPVEKAARLEDDINDVPCCNCQTGGKTEQCSTCPNVCHAQCGQTTLEDGQTSPTFICNLCQNEIVIRQTRSETHERQKDAAAGMAESSKKLFDDLQREDKVILAVPKVDRGPLDHQNVQGFVTDIRNGVYQVGTIGGIIKNWCARPDLRRIDCVDFDFPQIPREKFISIREAVAGGSMFGGQGVMKCSCKPSKKQCGTRRCLCFKDNAKCSSRCHHQLSCSNK